MSLGSLVVMVSWIRPTGGWDVGIYLGSLSVMAWTTPVTRTWQSLTTMLSTRSCVSLRTLLLLVARRGVSRLQVRFVY